MITIQALEDPEASDQPTDLSMKSPREECKKSDEEEEKSENPETENPPDLQKIESPLDQEMLDDEEKSATSPKQSFQESFLNLKHKNPATVSAPSSGRVSPMEDETPFGTGIADDVFMNGDGSTEKGEKAEEDTGVYTVKFLNFRMPENFAVIYLKFKQRGQTLGYFVKKTKME